MPLRAKAVKSDGQCPQTVSAAVVAGAAALTPVCGAQNLFGMEIREFGSLEGRLTGVAT
jgi:hypothetical protein